MKKICLFALVSAALALGACGDDGPSTAPIDDPTVTQTGTASGTSSLGLAGLPPGTGEDEGTRVVTTVGNALTSFGSSHQGYAATQGQDHARKDDSAGEIEYSYENGQLRARIQMATPQGTIDYRADLTINIEGADATLRSTLNGTLRIAVAQDAGGFQTTVNYDGRFDDITFDAAACADSPISGRITVDYDVQTSGAGLPGGSSGVAVSGLVRATYGAGCGDIQIEGT